LFLKKIARIEGEDDMSRESFLASNCMCFSVASFSKSNMFGYWVLNYEEKKSKIYMHRSLFFLNREGEAPLIGGYHYKQDLGL
jgi:hypothetical protein